MGKHKNIDKYLRDKGIDTDRCALYVGDYAIANDQCRAVDTKQDVLELIQNIISADHERFARECERAKLAGIRLLVLIEEPLPAGGLEAWEAPRAANGRPMTQVSGETLKRAMLTMTAKYGVKFRFCAAKDTGRVLVEYLTEGALPR